MLSPKMHSKKGCGDESLYRPGTGRGNNDPLASHDIEDLLNVVDGCEALQQEIEQAEPILKTYIVQQIGLLLKHRDFEYAVQSTARSNPDREAIIFRRLDALASLGRE